MIVRKHGIGIFVLLPALLGSSTLAQAEMPEAGSRAVTATPKASALTSSSTANAQPALGASGATSSPDKGDTPPVTRSLVPDSSHPGVEPTQPWPRSGALDESR